MDVRGARQHVEKGPILPRNSEIIFITSVYGHLRKALQYDRAYIHHIFISYIIYHNEGMPGRPAGTALACPLRPSAGRPPPPQSSSRRRGRRSWGNHSIALAPARMPQQSGGRRGLASTLSSRLGLPRPTRRNTAAPREKRSEDDESVSQSTTINKPAMMNTDGNTSSVPLAMRSEIEITLESTLIFSSTTSH